MFDFNNSLNDVAPVDPISLSVDVEGWKMVVLLFGFFCVFFLLSSRLRSSFVSVVFDFSASLSDVAPVFPIQLSLYVT